MLSNHLILYYPLLLPSIFPSITVFSNESFPMRIRWPEYCSFSFSISPSNEYSGLTSFRIYWFDLLAVQGTLKSFLQHHSYLDIFLATKFLILLLFLLSSQIKTENQHLRSTEACLYTIDQFLNLLPSSGTSRN